MSVRETDGTGHVILAASNGMAIRFAEDQVRSMGRTARGVRGIALKEGEVVVGMVVVDPEETDISLLAVTDNGYGKRTPVEDYRSQNRGGKGLITIKCNRRNGPLMAIRDVLPGEQLMVITRQGTMIRIALDDVSQQGRNTQGVRIINLKGEDRVASIARITHEAMTENDPEAVQGPEDEPVA